MGKYRSLTDASLLENTKGITLLSEREGIGAIYEGTPPEHLIYSLLEPLEETEQPQENTKKATLRKD